MSESPIKIAFVGAVNVDTVICPPDSLPTSAGKIGTKPVKERFGGGGYNAAMNAARLSQVFNNGVEVTLVTKIGAGENGHDKLTIDRLKAELSDAGIILVDTIEGQQSRLARNFVISGSDDRRIYVPEHSYPDMNPDMEQTLERVAAESKVTMVHTRLPEVAVEMAQKVHAQGNALVVDASAHSPELDEILGLVTHAMLPDELKGLNGKEHATRTEVMAYMRERGVPHSLVSCGGDPTLYHAPEADYTLPIPVICTDAFRMLGRTGAGDAAHAAFVLNLALANDTNDPEKVILAAHHANRFGTYKCCYEGMGHLVALAEDPSDIDHYVGDWETQFQHVQAALG